MKIIIFSDVHGNLPALEELLKKHSKVDQYINLGDVVNYGPWSNECVDLILNLENCINIKGNHEDYFIKGAFNGRNLLVQRFFDVCYSKFKRIKEIKTFKLNDSFNGYELVHTINNEYIYNDSKISIKSNTYEFTLA